jgi:hypothetical protein
MEEDPLDMLSMGPISLNRSDKIVDIHIPILDRWRWPPGGGRLRRKTCGSLARAGPRHGRRGRGWSFRNVIQPVRAGG